MDSLTNYPPSENDFKAAVGRRKFVAKWLPEEEKSICGISEPNVELRQVGGRDAL